MVLCTFVVMELKMFNSFHCSRRTMKCLCCSITKVSPGSLNAVGAIIRKAPSAVSGVGSADCASCRKSWTLRGMPQFVEDVKVQHRTSASSAADRRWCPTAVATTEPSRLQRSCRQLQRVPEGKKN